MNRYEYRVIDNDNPLIDVIASVVCCKRNIPAWGFYWRFSASPLGSSSVAYSRGRSVTNAVRCSRGVISSTKEAISRYRSLWYVCLMAVSPLWIDVDLMFSWLLSVIQYLWYLYSLSHILSASRRISLNVALSRVYSVIPFCVSTAGCVTISCRRASIVCLCVCVTTAIHVCVLFDV